MKGNFNAICDCAKHLLQSGIMPNLSVDYVIPTAEVNMAIDTTPASFPAAVSTPFLLKNHQVDRLLDDFISLSVSRGRFV